MDNHHGPFFEMAVQTFDLGHRMADFQELPK